MYFSKIAAVLAFATFAVAHDACPVKFRRDVAHDGDGPCPGMVVPQVAVPVKRHDACPMRHDGDGPCPGT